MSTIMVVDDAAFMRMKCAKLLTEHGYDVVEASSGSEAVETYKASAPDGVLLDITMPDMDGLTALKQLREHDPEARVAMVTAMGQQAIVIEGPQVGREGLRGQTLRRGPGPRRRQEDPDLTRRSRLIPDDRPERRPQPLPMITETGAHRPSLASTRRSHVAAC